MIFHIDKIHISDIFEQTTKTVEKINRVGTKMSRELTSDFQEHESNKSKIIDAARVIFARFGFKKTTMNEIAGSVFKAKSSIYYYYKSKEEIFKAIVEKEGNILKSELRQAIEKEADPRRQLRAYIITRAAYIKNLVNLYAALKEDYLKHYTFIDALRKQDFIDEQTILKGILQKGEGDGLFAISNLDLFAQAIVVALKGFEFSWALEKDMGQLERDTDALLEVIFNGLLKR
jgi:AcrR family transcriptional regulator